MPMKLKVARDKDGKRIEPIKFIRNITGMGLKASKDFVERGETEDADDYQWFDVVFNSDTTALRFLLEASNYGFVSKQSKYVPSEDETTWVI